MAGPRYILVKLDFGAGDAGGDVEGWGCVGLVLASWAEIFLNVNDVELKIRVRHQECCTRHKSVGLLAAVCYPCHTLLPILLAGSLDGWLA